MKPLRRAKNIEKLKKWVLARKGRLLLLSQKMNMDKNHLYAMLFRDTLSAELVILATEKQREVEQLEKLCIQKFPYFKRFVKKGNGRIPRLAEKMGVSAIRLRRLAKAEGDARYLMIGLGVTHTMQAIREVERDYFRYQVEGSGGGIKSIVTHDMRRSRYSINQIQSIADEIKARADYANQDAAVIFSKDGDKYRLVCAGYDTQFDDMCTSHICDKENPHIHAATMAFLNFPKKQDVTRDTGELFVFMHGAPCVQCAERLNMLGVSAVYCYFEPEYPAGINLLAQNGVPVYKINIVTGEQYRINKIGKAA